MKWYLGLWVRQETQNWPLKFRDFKASPTMHFCLITEGIFLFCWVQRPPSQGSVLVVQSFQKHSVWIYIALSTHSRAPMCSPGHSHLTLLLFHRNGLKGHKSIPVPTHLKGYQRGTESRHWIYQIPFRHDAQLHQNHSLNSLRPALGIPSSSKTLCFTDSFRPSGCWYKLICAAKLGWHSWYLHSDNFTVQET